VWKDVGVAGRRAGRIKDSQNNWSLIGKVLGNPGIKLRRTQVIECIRGMKLGDPPEYLRFLLILCIHTNQCRGVPITSP
jgi:hypothetical protein